MENTFRCATVSDVDFAAIADDFANSNSHKQAIFLYELFDELFHSCKNNQHNFTMQISYIADSLKDLDKENETKAEQGIKLLSEYLRE